MRRHRPPRMEGAVGDRRDAGVYGGIPLGGVGVTGAGELLRAKAPGMTTRGVLAGTRLGFTVAARTASHGADGVIFASKQKS